MSEALSTAAASRIDRRSFSSHSPHPRSPLTNSADFRRRSSSRRTNASSSSFSRPILTSRPVSLWTHEPPNFSTHDLVLNPDLIAAVGGISESSELFEIRLPDTASTANPLGASTLDDGKDAEGLASSFAREKDQRGKGTRKKKQKGILKKCFLFKASQAVGDLACIERSASQLQLSISRSIAGVFGFYNRCEVILSKVPRSEHTISHVELYFRDQYVGRADMWRLVSLLEDTCVHVGQKVTLANCVKATVGRIFIDEKKAMSGYVGPQTRSIFRSESSKFSIFIQMATEMWDFDEDGEMYYEKALSGFLPDLDRRWKNVPANHVISVILFSRVHYDESELHMLEEYALPLRQEAGGKKRWYIDYYKVLVDMESDCDWSNVLTLLKEEFFRFRHDVLLLRRPVAGPAGAPWLEEQHAEILRLDRALLAGTLSASHEGNVLEAVNLALNPYDEHYIDRDLNRTGLNLLVITAGTGHFDVDKKLLRLTTERLIDNGIGLDLVCLTKMPLHSVPLFHFQSAVPMPELFSSGTLSSSQGKSAGRKRRGVSSSAKAAGDQPSLAPDPLYFDPSHSSATAKPSSSQVHLANKDSGLVDFYGIPHWVDCSFYNLQQDKPFRANQFVPRCKMHEVQMLGLMENEISDISIPCIDFRKVPGIIATAGSSSANPAKSYSNASNATAWGSGNTKASRSYILASETFGDLSALGEKEQRRLMREHFDRETFRDLESIPSTYRSWIVHGGNDKSSGVGGMSGTSPTLRGSSYASAGSKRLGSSNSEQQNIRKSHQGMPIAKSPGKTLARGARASVMTSPRLESHDEHPASMDHVATVKQTHGSTRLSLISSIESLDTLSSGREDTVESPSRAASIRSFSTVGRGRRPMEPIGKAKALVASSQIDFESMQSGDAAQRQARMPASPAERKVAGLLHGSAERTQSPVRPVKVGYGKWLWDRFRSSDAEDQAGISESDKGLQADMELASPSVSEASQKIRSLLRVSSLRESQGPPSALLTPTKEKGLHEDGELFEGDDAMPSPILIPSQSIKAASKDGLPKNASTLSESHVASEQEVYEQVLEDEDAKARYAQHAQVEKQTLVNPSNPQKSLKGMNSSQIIRWQHLFPRRLNQHVVKWRSMTTPACLPLTTIYLPTEADLQKQWQEYPYQISISSDTASFLVKRASSTHPALAVLREMASQRLAQGFQFIVPANGLSLDSTTTNNPSNGSTREAGFRLREPWELFQPGMLASGVPIFLSMTNQIHRISYDRGTNSINVKRYVRRTDYDTSSIQYACCVWSRNLPGYQTVQSQFNYPDSGAYNWTYLDALIAGYSDDEEFGASTKFWRTRFVVVPSEGSPPTAKGSNGERLSDEEVRLMGMDRLADLFARARWRPKTSQGNGGSSTTKRTFARVSNVQAPIAPLRFIPTSLDPAISLRDEEFMKRIEAAHQDDSNEAHLRRPKKSNLARQAKELKHTDLVKEMYSTTSGLKINDRFWDRRTYKESFSGADFVTWLCREYDDMRTREEATEWGNHLIREKVLKHVHDYHGFLDGHYFYRLTPTYLAQRPVTQEKGWFAGGKARSSSGPEGRSSSMSRGTAEIGKSIVKQEGAGTGLLNAKSRRKVLLSRSMIIDVDPNRKSDRAEVALLHYDVAHNPANGFNFQIHWLGTTARFIEDTVQSWTRSVERYGLRCVEAPINQIKDVSQHNPFQAPLTISLALLPPTTSMFASLLPAHTDSRHFFQYALLRKFGFILDQEASEKYQSLSAELDIRYKSRPNHFDLTQFVHRTGVAFVQVLQDDDGFLWLDNRLFNSHLPSQQQMQQQQQQQQQQQSHPQTLTQQKGNTNNGVGSRDRESSNPSASSTVAANTSPSGASAAATAGTTLPSADNVRREFIDFCNNVSQLEAFYRQVLDVLQKACEAADVSQQVEME